jgi:hypothetical protein
MDKPQATITRARVRAYDAVTHTADLEPIAAPEALMDNVPCLQNIPITDLVVGNTISVLMWPDVGGLVLGAHGGLPTSVPSPHDILGAHHSISGGAALDLVGQSAAATIARVTPTDAPGATSRVLKTSSAGKLTVQQLKVNADLEVITDITCGGSLWGEAALFGGDLTLITYLIHQGDHIGFFNTIPAVKTAVTDQDAWAAVASGSDHPDLADLNTKMQAIRDKLQALLDALQSYGLV